MFARASLILLVLGLASSTAVAKPVRADMPGKKPSVPISVAEHGSLNAILAGEPVKTEGNRWALRKLGLGGTRLVRGLPLLMRSGEESYDSAVLTSEHVILKRKDGVFEVTRRADAEVQIRSGQTSPTDKVRVGLGPRGISLQAERGPAATFWLYRQLPDASHGQIASSSGATSFALSIADAYHPFGKPGQTVALAVPVLLFNRAVSGEIGGSGWGGFGMGIDVLEEIQFDSTPLARELHLPGF